MQELPEDFQILKWSPGYDKNYWIYATCGMSENCNESGLELHILSGCENDFLIELLTVIAHYHITENELGYGHTVNFGCPLCNGSMCKYGLISLPYLDGSSLEWLNSDEKKIQFLWLIPITQSERNFKKKNGLDALENLFENEEFNYLDPFRKSVTD
ncbi:MAG: suppressor of fused domain protein [Ruminococcus sp.]|nr:suppressor of fused domain protein [Ruminococcus sp.]